MKKTLIASAVALATLASASAGAQELKLPKVYGNVQLILKQVDTEGASSFDMGDTGSTIGFSHEHEIRPGLTAFAKAEFEFDASENKGSNDDGLNTGDQAFIGLKGDFGLVKAGSFDSIFEDAISDSVSDLFEDLGDQFKAADTAEGDTVAYYSPKYNGLQVAVAVQLHGANDDGDHNSPSAVVSYDLSSDTKIALAWDSANGVNNAGSALGVSLVHKMGDIRLGASFETQDERGDVLGVSGVYTLGANQFIAALQYGMPDDDNLEDSPVLTLQALHNMSDNFYVYVEGEWADNYGNVDGDDYTALVLGATYVF